MMVVKIKKQKAPKSISENGNLNCLKAGKFENERNHLQKHEIDVDSLKIIKKNS